VQNSLHCFTFPELVAEEQHVALSPLFSVLKSEEQHPAGTDVMAICASPFSLTWREFVSEAEVSCS
jgi:hypothetical protein